MARSVVIAAAALIVATVLVPAAAAAPAGQGEPVGRYIVVLRDGEDPYAVAREHTEQLGARVSFVYTAALDGYAAALPEARLEQLRADPRVELISEDRAVAATAQQLPTGISRVAAPAATGGTIPSFPFAVAVIDTGIDTTHPDLTVVGGKNCSTGTSYADGNGHGTHVSGTIGAKNDGAGVVGIAPGIPLLAVRVLDNRGSGSWSSVVCGIDWVTQNAAGTSLTGGRPIRVASMSLGGSGSDGACNADALHRAICNSTNAGVLYVVAAGNSNANLATFVPATYREVLAVTAIADFNGQPGGGASPTCRSDVDDTSADFSNFVSVSDTTEQAHTIAAPGVCILSTWKGSSYNTISGTSMATPHVSGAAALCIARGTCTGKPADMILRLRSDAATKNSAFVSASNKYFGPLLDASY